MMFTEVSQTAFSDASIQLSAYLPSHQIYDAAELYHRALADKLVPVYGRGLRAQQALASGFNRHMCLTALDQGRLVGLLGMQTATAGFMRVTLKRLRPFYGIFGSLWRMLLLDVLHHTPLEGEAYIDGVVVAPGYRGRGIGSGLIAAMEAWAAGQGLWMIRLEVVDSNPRAEELYHRLGFEAVRTQTVWPFSTLFGFRSSTVMIKSLA